MLSVLGASRNVWPVDEVTITRRMLPLESVTIWLTVPMLVPLEFTTLRPVLSPGSALLATAPPASTLCALALAMPVVEAWFSPWLVPTAGLVKLPVVELFIRPVPARPEAPMFP
jgi:hypothetical protein